MDHDDSSLSCRKLSTLIRKRVSKLIYYGYLYAELRCHAYEEMLRADHGGNIQIASEVGSFEIVARENKITEL